MKKHVNDDDDDEEEEEDVDGLMMEAQDSFFNNDLLRTEALCQQIIRSLNRRLSGNNDAGNNDDADDRDGAYDLLTVALLHQHKYKEALQYAEEWKLLSINSNSNSRNTGKSDDGDNNDFNFDNLKIAADGNESSSTACKNIRPLQVILECSYVLGDEDSFAQIVIDIMERIVSYDDGSDLDISLILNAAMYGADMGRIEEARGIIGAAKELTPDDPFISLLESWVIIRNDNGNGNDNEDEDEDRREKAITSLINSAFHNSKYTIETGDIDGIIASSLAFLISDGYSRRDYQLLKRIEDQVSLSATNNINNNNNNNNNIVLKVWNSSGMAGVRHLALTSKSNNNNDNNEDDKSNWKSKLLSIPRGLRGYALIYNRLQI